MSFIYSLALVEESWPANNLDTDASVPLSGSLTPRPSLWHDKTMAVSRLSRFGMTCKPLTDGHGAALLTLWLAASRARTYPSPAKARALMAPSQECGATWRGSLARFDPSTFSWRTAQPSLLEDLGESSVIWPRSGMTAAGQCWELPMLGRRISAKGSGLEPNGQTFFHTPNTNGLDGGSNSRRALARRVNGSSQGSDATLLTSAIAHDAKAIASAVMWPTPTVCGNYNRKGASTTSGDGLATAVKFAMPLARDWRSGKSSQATHDKNSRPLSEQIGGSLNPTWVEWLMGWPLGWTDLKPLATDKFQPAQPPLGES